MAVALKKPVTRFNFKEFLQTKEFVGLLIAFLGSYFLFPYFFELHLLPLGTIASDPSIAVNLNKSYPYLSLDPSWIIALSKFNIDHRVWGEDIAFTYGPLAYLSTRVGWGASWYSIFLFDLFMSFNFFYIFYQGFVKSKNLIATISLIIATCILLPSTFGSGNALVLLAFLIFWIRQSIDDNKILFYVMQIAILILTFFIKFNTSVISIVFFIAALVYRAIFTKEDKRILAVYLVIPAILIVILSKMLNVSIVGYVLGGLNTVSGFNEIMYLTLPVVKEYKYTWGIILISLFILLFKAYKVKNNRPFLFKNLLLVFLFSASIYVLYKQAFLRNDIEHILDFNKFALLFILCLYDFHYTKIFKFSNILIGLIIFFSFLFSSKRNDKLFKMNERVFKNTYVKELKNFSDSSGYHLFPSTNSIPLAIKEKIGNKSVDVFSWNIHMLLENQLNYLPRPAFQSYVAYTPYLENLNFDFYNSAKAPEYLLYDMDAIDGRSGFLDEPKLNLAVIKNYEYVDNFSFAQRPVMLLKRKSGTLPIIKLEKINEYNANINTTIQPKENVYYEIRVSNTLSGKIEGVLGHSPDIFLVITTKNGAQQEFRTSKKMLETGFFSTYLLNSTADVYNYMRKEGMKTENEIISYSLRLKTPSHFNNTVTISEYKIN